MKKKLISLTLFSLAVLISCADNIPYTLEETVQLVGFWHGLWHGLTLGFAFIGSLFSDSIAIYATYNNGGCYNFGYFLGIVMLVVAGRASQ